MNRIKYLRTRENMKQADLASAINVSPSTLSGYETGKFEATLETYKKMAAMFHVSLDYLLGWDEELRSEPSVQRQMEAQAAPSFLERSLLRSFHALNDEGKLNLVDYADTLVNSGKYAQGKQKEHAG